MKKRNWLVWAIAGIFVFSSIIPVSAMVAVEPYPEDMAVYLNEGFYGDSAIVNGSIYSANGNIQFTNSGSNRVTGDIYHKVGTEFIIPKWYNPDFANRVITLDSTEFVADMPELIDFPNTDEGYQYVQNCILDYNNQSYTVSENTHFGTLKVDWKGVTVDVSQGDIYMVVDNLSFAWGKTIKLQGDGRLFLFINNYDSSQQIKIINGNDPDKTYIFSKVNLAHANMNLYAHVYYQGIADLNMYKNNNNAGGKITGSVVTDATTLGIKGGSTVNGLVYAPNAEAVISHSGKINGSLVAKSLNISGSGKITYAFAFSNWLSAFPDAVLKQPEVQKYNVNVSSSNSTQGTVSVTSEGQDVNGTEVEDGTQITMTAVPANGYIFTGFKDGNGNVVSTQPSYTTTVNGSVDLTAFFAPEVISSEYVNGLLGEYYDSSELTNDSALRMRRIDDIIAYNFGYGSSPASVIEPESFAIRWTGFIRPTVTGDYTFKTYSDDGVRVNVNGQQVIDNWGAYSLAYSVAPYTVHLEAGNYYPITVEYQQLPLYAGVFLFWKSNEVPMGLVPASDFFVTQTVHDTYLNPQYYNHVQGEGNGFVNKFYNSKNDFENERDDLVTERNSVNYSWGFGVPWLAEERADGSIYYNQDDTDAFYGIMEGYLEARFTENTTLEFIVDDGIKVWVGDENGNWFNQGNPVISEWGWNNVETFEYSFDTVVGQKYKIRIEYMDKGYGASCVMGWKSGALGDSQTIAKKYLYSD